MDCVICLALRPIKCPRHPHCGRYDTSLVYAPLKILRTYDE
jgi:hypothetical protein